MDAHDTIKHINELAECAKYEYNNLHNYETVAARLERIEYWAHWARKALEAELKERAVA